MNRAIKTFSVVLISLVISTEAIAALVLNGTRFIHHGDSRNISVEIRNNAEKTFGGQAWIDNISQNQDSVFMVPSPAFFKIKPNQKQIIRLMKVSNSLPTDQEYLFWLNVQEIPPKLKGSEGSNVIAFSMNTKVKVIHRPVSIAKDRQGAEQKIRIEQRNGKVYLSNPTPYFFAVVQIMHNGESVELSDESRKLVSVFKPFSEVEIVEIISQQGISISAINDWGGVETYKF